jgi:hypothetical protein
MADKSNKKKSSDKEDELKSPTQSGIEAIGKKQFYSSSRGAALNAIPKSVVRGLPAANLVGAAANATAFDQASEKWSNKEYRPAIVQGVGAAAGMAGDLMLATGIGTPAAAALKGINLGTEAALAEYYQKLKNDQEISERIKFLRNRSLENPSPVIPFLDKQNYKNQVNDLSDFNTKLSNEDERMYEAYKKSLGEQGTEHDYDLRGYWKKYGRFEGEHELGSHFTDEFKKPNHPTFSTGSIYHGSQNPNGTVNIGGEWLTNPDGKDVFAPPNWRYSDPVNRSLLQYYLDSPFGEQGQVSQASPTMANFLKEIEKQK